MRNTIYSAEIGQLETTSKSPNTHHLMHRVPSDPTSMVPTANIHQPLKSPKSAGSAGNADCTFNFTMVSPKTLSRHHSQGLK